MEQAPDKLILDISDSDELKELFSRKSPGDTITITKLVGTIDEQVDGRVQISVDGEVEVSDTEPEAEEEDEEEAAAPGEPVMEFMKKRKAPPPDPKAVADPEEA
jgi:hypothetical protein